MLFTCEHLILLRIWKTNQKKKHIKEEEKDKENILQMRMQEVVCLLMEVSLLAVALQISRKTEKLNRG